ncbi:MAG: MarR family transcriptional regulator [Candidatus Hodarchaeota archaeon]
MCPHSHKNTSELDQKQVELTALEKLIQLIQQRAEPKEDKDDLARFLTNVFLFIKRVEGFELSVNEKQVPAHSQFAHYTLTKGPDTAAGLKHRLKIIDRYRITEVQRIINIIASTAVSVPTAQLTPRQIRIILELHENPLVTQNQLAQKLSTTSQTIKRELDILQRSFSLAVIYHSDFHKFKLALIETDFRTKSLDASERLEQFFRRTPPLFMRRIGFDHDFRSGYVTYMIPDQPRGFKLFEQRLRWLNDEFLEDYFSYRVTAFYSTISFDGYDPITGKWVLGSDTIVNAMLQHVSRYSQEFTPSRTLILSEPIRFDQIDYIIAQTPYSFGQSKRLEIREKVLEKHGFKLAKKSIRNRERRLEEAGIFYPTLWFDIPDFEESVQLTIECTPEATKRLKAIPAILPQANVGETSSGLNFTFQRPSYCSSITGFLVRMIGLEKGVSKVFTLRHEPTFSPQMLTETVIRWDESRQRWTPQEGDI